MGIIASAKVPAQNRANPSDEPTIPVQRGPLGNRDQVDDRRPSDLLPYRKPSNSPAVELGKRAYDLMARNDRARRPSTVETLAVELHVDQAELMAGIAAFLTASTGVEFGPTDSGLLDQAEETMWWNTPTCSAATWCERDHTDGGDLHERVVLQSTGQNPSQVDSPATVRVYVECCTEAGRIVEAPRVIVAISHDTDGGCAGEQGVKAWSGTPDELRAFIAAATSALNMVDGPAA